MREVPTYPIEIGARKWTRIPDFFSSCASPMPTAAGRKHANAAMVPLARFRELRFIAEGRESNGVSQTPERTNHTGHGRMFPSPSSPQSPWTLTARWIFPVSGPPMAGGVLTISGKRIVSVEPAGARKADVDLGDIAVLPGLVNAHTHLDLTGLRGQCPPSADFTGWLRRVIAHRRNVTPEQIETDIRAGLAESLRHGTTLLGDITAAGMSWPILVDAPLRSVVFYELLGLTQERATAALESALDWLMVDPTTSTCRPGLSPHAPYSVRVNLLAGASLLAQQMGCPLAIHVAESRDELELLQHRRGPFVPFLKDLGVWDADGLAMSPEEVMQLCGRISRRLFIHGNYLAPSSSLTPNSSIVYCPRTHAAFGHAPHPFRDFLARGVRVALGTDSLASNPDLSILAEVRFLHQRCPDVPGATLLRMATLAGAEALGWADETGSLEAGKSADLVVVPLGPGPGDDPYKRLLESDAPVQRVLCRGQWIASSG
jgi:cytosine/adenosine deaminase-related metal-dependent hydrolase